MLRNIDVSFSKALLVVALSFLFGCSGAQKTTVVEQIEETRDTIKTAGEEKENEVIEEIPDSLSLAYPLNQKEEYNISYFLPLFLNDYPSLSSQKKFYAEVALDYWWGAQLAFDTLSKAGFNGNVSVVDTRNDTSTITNALKNLDDTVHLFFGPLFPNNLKAIREYASEHNANVISPLATVDECNDFTDRFIFSKPTIAELNRSTASLIENKYDSTYEVFIFCRAVDYEVSEAERIKSSLPSWLQEKVTIDKINKNFIDKNYLKDKLPDSAVVVICSDRETFVTTVIAELRRSLNNHNVIGRESWLDFQSMDSEAWARLNMHFVCTQNVNYNDTLLKRFIKKYRKKYSAEPGKYAIAGYFESIYYCLYLHNYGTNFQRFNNELIFELPYNSINLVQDDSCKFFYNNQVKVLKFKDHKLIEIE
ncbi:MAG: amino acid ABC transporter substrate-binding protein [Bacteroidia bacterium]